MLAIAAVSVISKIRLPAVDAGRARARPRSASAARVVRATRPERLTSRRTSRPARACSASSSIARATTQRSIAWIRPKRSAGGEERARRDQLAVRGRASAAAARTATTSPVRRSSDRLRVEHEAVVLERAADAVGPARAAPARAACASLEPYDADAVAAGLLGLVHGQVGRERSAPRPRVAPVAKQRDADAGRSRAPPARRAGERARPRPPRSRSLGDLRALGLVDLREQHRELVAAEPRDDVGLAQARRRAARRRCASSSSPAAWPSVSLTYLKLSRSSISTAPPPP